MNLGPLHLMRPEWLWALIPVVLALLVLRLARRRSGSWSQVISPALLPYLVADDDTGSRRYLPWIAAGWLLAVVALCGPSFYKIPQPVLEKDDALVIVLDLSYSMKAEDTAPSRLDRARQKIIDLLQQRKEGQTALVAYAGDAHVVTPLTDDAPTIINLLPALSPDMMPLPGSAADSAINEAIELLHSGSAGGGRIVLITDGVSQALHGDIADAIDDADVDLTIIGVGSAEGAPLKLPEGGFLKDRDGTIVVPTLDEPALSALASQAGGQYLGMRLDNTDLAALLQNSALPGDERLSATGREADHWEDQGYYLVLLLLPLALFGFRRGALLSLLPLLLLTGQPQPAAAQSWDDLWLTSDQQGQRALNKGDAETASTLFEDPAWRGTAAYENGDYQAAAQEFSRGDSADDWYNRGNALTRADDLDGAIEAYQRSLEINPGQDDAEANLALVEELKKQREQQEQQQQQDSQDESDQQQNDQQQDQSSSEQNNSSSQGQQQSQGGQQNEQSPGDSDPQSDGSQQQSEQPPSTAGENSAEEESSQTPESTPEGDEESTEQAKHGDSTEADEADDGDAQQSAAAEAVDPEQAEQDQAMQQWLRRVPDDPAGLLREKFYYESRQRRAEGEEPRNEEYW